MRVVTAILSLLLVAAAPALAQQPTTTAQAGEELVDRVVAVVGDTVLLLSDVQAELQQLQAAGRPIPTDPQGQARLAEEIIESRVEQLVLVTAARRSGVQIRDEEIQPLVEQDLRTVQQRFGSEANLRAALAASGMSLEQYRGVLGAQYRDRMLVERFLPQQLSGEIRPAVSEAEIREMFEAQRGAIGARPATVSFRQIIIEPRPSEAARQAAIARAEEVLRELRDGTSFEVLARRYSEDTGTREHGGDLGWFRRGRMVPAFENVAFNLRPGQTSGIVETEFGLHIIRVERARGPERQARHILIRPEMTEEDFARARERADSVANAAREGASFTELMRRYPAPGDQGTVEQASVDRLPPAYASAFADAESGQIVGPFESEGPTGRRWIVARLTQRHEAGDYTLEDVRDQIRARLQEQKMVEALVDRLREEMHVRILL
ncbi:MAG TPA: peptidylprolyl isomerase [Longimicrobiaceae bacterium]|nr:peptidylprolyl isomerase [Longimicrobiaceae bacterium]